jgi:hypothetical protein
MSSHERLTTPQSWRPRKEWTVDEIFHDRRFDTTKRIVPDSWVRTQHALPSEEAVLFLLFGLLQRSSEAPPSRWLARPDSLANG